MNFFLIMNFFINLQTRNLHLDLRCNDISDGAHVLYPIADSSAVQGFFHEADGLRCSRQRFWWRSAAGSSGEESGKTLLSFASNLLPPALLEEARVRMVK